VKARALWLACFVGCGGAPPAEVHVSAVPPSLETLARRGFEGELRRLGWRVESSAHELVASRGADRYAIALVVETSAADRGPKVTVRLSLFDAESHSLQGEVSSWAVAVGQTPSEAEPTLARVLGEHAADKLERMR
jgi:hypothetical protein